MGQLVDGVWQDTCMTQNPPVGVLSVPFPPSVTGSPPMARPARVAKGDLRRKKIAIICTSLSPARGRIAR